jgi:hypothetical protein
MHRCEHDYLRSYRSILWFGLVWPYHCCNVGMGGAGMTKDEALDLALEIMHNQGDVGVDEWLAAEVAIKQARSAPVQEPVAWIDVDEKGAWSGLRYWSEPDNRHEVALYTTPPAAQRQWVGLTDEEMDELVNRFARYELVRATENLLRSKNA